MPPDIRILLVDDHALFRRGLVALLGEAPAMQVVGQAGDAGEALRLATQLQPDIILLDNHLPGVRGIDAVESLRQAAPASRVLMLTVSEEAADLGAALRAGASGYLLKTCETDELIGGIQRALRGEVVIGADMTAKLAQAFIAPETTDSAKEALPANAQSEKTPLSPRERQIAAAIARGASNKVIARELDIAETTVKVHVQSILRKLDLSSRVQIAVYASEHGLSV
ncbi:Two component transcriptional regulator, LuxR family [Thiomonas arsenitoxydans]|jgi:two-component system nitrate/nitrite response regulator NarL|uniref:Nitrate/nitrite response regulator protein narL n=2 Tax=Thiomonas TaxID=32012 RepID=D6CLP8_THIA3|nr:MULTISPECIES: response regulator [Thiomonas]MDE2176432.1 response regulator [Betaproteobacteria bacterium]CQR43646.1 Two component transcriptional regulator, LuxR family [Thiomonas sp. CB3]MDD5002085.1 response regulator [Thiomonas arsenitoxydans]OZB72134.1 MAG: DNA-binding response regulator [Thiomonas sp. 13-64-67]CAZ89476.1 putative Nitrate/nitrite response regulator protein narL [Thiomonas arsenitoxydans]